MKFDGIIYGKWNCQIATGTVENNHIRGIYFGKIGNSKCLDVMLYINTTFKMIFMEQKDMIVWCSLPLMFLSH